MVKLSICFNLFCLRKLGFILPTGFSAGIAIYHQRFVVMRSCFRSESILSNTDESLSGVRLISPSKSSSVLNVFQDF